MCPEASFEFCREECLTACQGKSVHIPQGQLLGSGITMYVLRIMSDSVCQNFRLPSLVPPFLVASVYKSEILSSSPGPTAYPSTHSSNEYGLGT